MIMPNTFPPKRGQAPDGLALFGTRVLDLTRLAPGPFASLVLADLGAEVIKVEEPNRGDWLRYPIPSRRDGVPVAAEPRPKAGEMEYREDGHRAAQVFELLNRNKKSVTLNLKTAEGKAILQQLVRAADVLLEGFRAGTMRRMGLDYESLRTINPCLVYASLSGYGQSGPYRRRACHDLNCLALAGLLDLSGPEDGAPAMSALPWVDMVAGLWTALGIVAALLARQRSGLGQYLDISMLDSVAALMHVPMSDWLAAGVPPQRGRTFLSGELACYNVYETADGRYMTLGALEPQFWEDFCTAVGREDWVPRHRSRDQASLRAAVAGLFRTQPQAYWTSLFAARDCCCEPVLALDEAFAHPQAVQRGLLREGWLATPLASSGVEFAPAPQLGEQTAQILAELGYTLEDVQRLRQNGVV
jgi:crotonobetainyl-CoA:carnitine CoA-transferase CaiB-like acyl-CoA transferase